jgi:hypothetical protein
MTINTAAIVATRPRRCGWRTPPAQCRRISPQVKDDPATSSPTPGRHGIAELLTLVGEIRWLAFGTLPPIEALGRIRDAFHEYDGA